MPVTMSQKQWPRVGRYIGLCDGINPIKIGKDGRRWERFGKKRVYGDEMELAHVRIQGNEERNKKEMAQHMEIYRIMSNCYV